MGALTEGVGHHAVNADGSEQQRYRRKNTEKLESKTPVSHGSGDDLIHRTDTVHRNIEINALNFVPHGLTEFFRVTHAAKENNGVDWRELPQGNINMRHTGSLKAVGLDIASHADDREPQQTAPKAKPEFLSERILAGPIAPCEGLVDHRNRFCLIAIGVAEI